METKYPHIEVQLSGEDSNAFHIIGQVAIALRKNGIPKPEIEEFRRQATSGDYDHLLQVCFEWVNIA
jgi:hypothetical protein